MKNQNHSQRNRFIWAAIITVVCLRALSAQTNTFPTTGNAGVGTTSPTQKLEVSGGPIKITGGGLYIDNDQAIRAGGGDQGLVYRSSSNGIFFGSGDPNDFTVLNAGGAERFRLATNGRAGLGTNNPAAMFDVSNPNGNLWSHWAHSTATTGQNYGILINAGTNSSDFSFRAQNASGSAELFGVRGDGNVGIGTASPSYPLHVSRSASDQYLGWFENTQSSPGLARLRVQNTAAQGSFEIDVLENGNTYFQTGKSANSPSLSILSGNVGIGTTNPYSKFHVSGGDISVDANQGMRKSGDNWIIGYSNSLPGIAIGSGTTTDQVSINSGGSERLRVLSNGNVGIGTTTPAARLDVRTGDFTRIQSVGGATNGYGLMTTSTDGSYSSYAEFGSFGSAYSGTLFGQSVGNWSFLYAAGTSSNGLAIGTNNSKPVLLGTANTERMRIDSSGNVAIGTTNPGSYKLNVNGDTNVAGNLNIVANGTSPGNIVAAGTIAAKYQDVAEWVPSSEQLPAGTVVVLDSTKSNQVTSSTVSYDTRVAGVVSEQPGLALGEKSDGKVLVATTGRVRVKVDATKSPIHVGDLLVTSDVLGVAMKSDPVNLGGVQFHRPGTLIGKALEPLEKGKGEILVLLSLQ